MPKQTFIKVQLAPERYDRCLDCPLCGLIPENDRRDNLKYACLATLRAMSDEDAASSKDKVSQPCEKHWETFMQLPDRIYNLSERLYNTFRLPFEQAKDKID